MLKTLSNSRLYLIIGVASLVALGGSFGAGYLSGGRNEARIQIKEVEKRVYVPVIEYQQVQVRNVERERLLEVRLAQANGANQSLRSRLSVVPANDCVVARGAVGVLNEAISGAPTTNPAGVFAGSTTTVTDLTDWSFGAITQYNDVSIRYNALIDWVDEELIKPQQ